MKSVLQPGSRERTLVLSANVVLMRMKVETIAIT